MSGWLIPILMFAGVALAGEPGRIYTKTDASAAGGIAGKTGVELTHAIAVDHERQHVFLADLADAGKEFRFQHLPVGKYDLVLVTSDGAVFEGLMLGVATNALPANLVTRVAVADSFFNRYTIHRCGFVEDRAFVFVERLRDRLTLKQSGEQLDANVRRLEIIELEQATDDWQMVRTRHIYRDAEQKQNHPPFFRHAEVPALGNIRVVDSVKQLGMLNLPKN
jgi:hypothetical protein